MFSFDSYFWIPRCNMCRVTRWPVDCVIVLYMVWLFYHYLTREPQIFKIVFGYLWCFLYIVNGMNVAPYGVDNAKRQCWFRYNTNTTTALCEANIDHAVVSTYHYASQYLVKSYLYTACRGLPLYDSFLLRVKKKFVSFAYYYAVL